MTELLVGTKKGLFVVEGEPGSPFEVTARAFAGDPVEYAIRDPRSGRVHASVTSPFYGPKIFYTDDLATDWEQAAVRRWRSIGATGRMIGLHVSHAGRLKECSDYTPRTRAR